MLRTSRSSLRVAIDIGSMTVKLVVLGRDDTILYSRYQRHSSAIVSTLHDILQDAIAQFGDTPATICITGSGALSMAGALGIRFIQEVNAAALAIQRLYPESDTAIDIGGEDSKAIFLYPDGRFHRKMNGNCAAGTGAYLDRMAELLGVTLEGLNDLAKNADRPIPIAPRCGVFAQTDVQSAINSNTPHADIAAGILNALATQLLGDVLQGKVRRCRKVILLGGPFTFLSELRAAMARKLPEAQLHCPDNAEILVAIGAALASAKQKTTTTLAAVLHQLEHMPEPDIGMARFPPLFTSEEEHQEFRHRHQTAITLPDESCATPPYYLGIDSGSTTFKFVLIDSLGRIVRTYYNSNQKNRQRDGREQIRQLRQQFDIAHTVAIGYGEDGLISSGLADSGEVETVAHLEAATHLMPDVRLIVDIGGQDVKIFSVSHGIIREIKLNESCSSGCGAFLLTYVNSLGEGKYTLDQFDSIACTSQAPVNLGSRCTVFMNSAIKQAQREGVSFEDIAGGLSYSIVSNIFHKILPLSTVKNLGGRIVVQGGTFMNDSVLRAFELTIGTEVVRPEIPGLMGAYGASLLALERARDPSLIPTKPTIAADDLPDLPTYKYNLLQDRRSADYWQPGQTTPIGTVHIPLALNMYENLPFWFAFWSTLGYEVIVDLVDEHTFDRGIDTVFSETVCYPAKLVHGLVAHAVENKQAEFIFFPSIKWEREECPSACNHVNCPVVMGYPEAIRNNMPTIAEHGTSTFFGYLPYDKPRQLPRFLRHIDLLRHTSRRSLKSAVEAGLAADAEFKHAMQLAGEQALDFLTRTGARGVIQVGHPYQVDPFINHGIPRTLRELGFAVFTEDSVAHLAKRPRLRVLDQWVYHGRMYNAAAFVGQRSNLQLIQITNFNCGVDAITSDQIKEILEQSDKIYTQIMVDAIRDTRPIKIRIRSLIAALKKRGEL